MYIKKSIGLEAGSVESSRADREISDAVSALQDCPLVNGRLIKDLSLTDYDGESYRVNHGLGRTPSGVLVVASDALVQPVIQSKNSKSMELTFSFQWEQIRYKEFTSATPTGIWILASDLDSTVDHQYKCEFYIVNTSGLNGEYRIVPNAVAANQDSEVVRGASGAVASADGNAMEMLTTSSPYVAGEFTLMANVDRKVFWSVVADTNTTPTCGINIAGGSWIDSQRITRLDIRENNSRIYAGSWARLYRKPKEATVSLWVF